MVGYSILGCCTLVCYTLICCSNVTHASTACNNDIKVYDNMVDNMVDNNVVKEMSSGHESYDDNTNNDILGALNLEERKIFSSICSKIISNNGPRVEYKPYEM